MPNEVRETANGFQYLQERIISKGLCTTCGACAGVCPSQVIEMHIENYESDDPEPRLEGDCTKCGVCISVCPGKDVPLAEMDRFVFGKERGTLAEPLGIYNQTLRGYAEGPARDISSSGGVVTAVIRYALDKGVIDGAILAIRSKEHPWRAEAGIITKSDEISKAVRTVVEVVPVVSALHEAVINKGLKKVALVGLPCQIHSIRKLQMAAEPKELAEAIVFTMGLHCTSTAHFIGVEHILKEIGDIEDFNEIVTLDTRVGAWHGPVLVATKDNKIHTIAKQWLYDTFAGSQEKRDRCLMCIDYSAELADISCGDILQNIDGNQRWTSVITRTDIGDCMINEAAKAGYIYVEPHKASMIPASGNGWEATKHACMFRWQERKRNGWAVPDYQYPPEIKILPRKIARPKQ